MIASLALTLATSAPVPTETLILDQAQDATLYEDPTGQTANGAGRYLFSGVNAAGLRRRALLRFVLLDAIPSHSTIVSARLRLHASQVAASPEWISVHRVTHWWAVGASNAPGDEADGTQAQVPDATWIHAYYTNGVWATPGGDHLPLASDTVSVDALGYHELDVTDDVQFQLDEYQQNFGWLLVADEDASAGVVRFDSRQSPEFSLRPSLVVEYELPECGTNYCISAPNSTGLPARMDYEGSCVVSQNDLTLIAAPVPSDWGIFFYGTQPTGGDGVPFGNGYRCVGDGSSPLVRFAPTLAQANEHRMSLDLTSLPAHSPVVAGDTRYFQLWFRDPGAGGSYFSLSDGLWIHFQ